jgi:hypothetical protein
MLPSPLKEKLNPPLPDFPCLFPSRPDQTNTRPQHCVAIEITKRSIPLPTGFRMSLDMPFVWIRFESCARLMWWKEVGWSRAGSVGTLVFYVDDADP